MKISFLFHFYFVLALSNCPWRCILLCDVCSLPFLTWLKYNFLFQLASHELFQSSNPWSLPLSLSPKPSPAPSTPGHWQMTTKVTTKDCAHSPVPSLPLQLVFHPTLPPRKQILLLILPSQWFGRVEEWGESPTKSKTLTELHVRTSPTPGCPVNKSI